MVVTCISNGVTTISMLENVGELRLIKQERAKGNRDRKTNPL